MSAMDLTERIGEISSRAREAGGPADYMDAWYQYMPALLGQMDEARTAIEGLAASHPRRASDYVIDDPDGMARFKEAALRLFEITKVKRSFEVNPMFHGTWQGHFIMRQTHHMSNAVTIVYGLAQFPKVTRNELDDVYPSTLETHVRPFTYLWNSFSNGNGESPWMRIDIAQVLQAVRPEQEMELLDLLTWIPYRVGTHDGEKQRRIHIGISSDGNPMVWDDMRRRGDGALSSFGEGMPDRSALRERVERIGWRGKIVYHEQIRRQRGRKVHGIELITPIAYRGTMALGAKNFVGCGAAV